MPIQSAQSRALSEVTAVLDDLRRIVQVLRESSRAAEQKLGVSGAQLFVMKALAAEPAQSLNDLALRTRTHQSTVSVVVKRLVGQRLVKRATSRSDARRIELSLTPRGRALLDRSPLAAQERLIEGIEAMPRARRQVLSRGLHELVAAMQLGTEPPQMFFEDSAPRATPGGARGKV